MMHQRRAQFFSIFTAIAAGTTAVAAAEPAANPSLTKDWVFDAGAVFEHLDGSATSQGNGVGGSVSFSQIGLEDWQTSPYLALRWRFADAWRFDFNFVSLDGGASRGNSTEFEFGHSTFPAGYELSADYNQRVYTAGIGYSFVKTPQTELGARLSVGVIDTDVSLKGSAWLGGTKLTAGPEEAGNVWVMPTLGIYGTYALTNQWTIDGSVDGLAFSYDGYEGSYIAATANLTYWFTDTFAIAAGYRYVDSNLKHDGSNWQEEIDVRNSGPVVKASVGF